jgi:hypothetical protein
MSRGVFLLCVIVVSRKRLKKSLAFICSCVRYNRDSDEVMLADKAMIKERSAKGI